MLKKIIPVAWHYPLSQFKRAVVGYSTYSQFGEDAVLAQLFKDAPRGVYIDVGAHHPYRYSNTYLLFKKGWHGTNIDASAQAIRLFDKARPHDTNVCSGVGAAGELVYYEFSDPAFNTFNKAEAEVTKQKSFVSFVGERRLPVWPLSTFVQGPFDLLTVDVEGMDREVLESYDWRYIPRVVVVEGEECTDFLASKGYTLHARCGKSTIYVLS